MNLNVLKNLACAFWLLSLPMILSLNMHPLDGALLFGLISLTTLGVLEKEAS